MTKPTERPHGTAILEALARRATIVEKVGIVAAHPDDETIGMGAQLSRFNNAVLLHTTDGAPRNGHDSGVHGFIATADYAAARRHELAAALRVGGADKIRCETLGMSDQTSWFALAELAKSIADWLREERPAIVFVQPYEGGHPDHDAAAFAVYGACGLNEMNGEAVPTVIEIAAYHAAGDSRATGTFLPGGGAVLCLDLSGAARRRKQLMLDCFVTQRETLAGFNTETERFRLAPKYDFTRPPHAGRLYYERYDWGITGAMWRRCAVAARAELRLVRS